MIRKTVKSDDLAEFIVAAN